MRLKWVFLCVFLVFGQAIYSQNFNSGEFVEADMALVDMNFERAQELFSKLLKSEPENANLNFLNGLCLINIPFKKKESLEFFEKAEPFASASYKYGNPREQNAPLEVTKYLGIARKIHNDLNGAIDAFLKYKTTLGTKDKAETALVDELIESCYNAKTLQESSVHIIKIDEESLPVSMEMPAYPVVSSDETMLFFAANGSGINTNIYISRKINGKWGAPENITSQLDARGMCYPSSVSTNNLTLYLTYSTAGSTDIYYSVFSKNRWQKMVKMEKPINGSTWDSHASESPDGNSLYFSSDRSGGFGNMDIYRVDKDAAGQWTKPVNLGSEINTEKNELMPIVLANNSKLFFKSESFENLGGYDIFVSEQTAPNRWGNPKNIGYPVNSTDDDIYFMPVRDGNFAYAISENQLGLRTTEISLIEIREDMPVQDFAVKGTIIFDDGTLDYSGTRVEVFNNADFSKVSIPTPENINGNFSFTLPIGIYSVVVSKPSYKSYSEQLNLSETKTSNEYTFTAKLENEAPVATPEPVAQIIPEPTPVVEVPEEPKPAVAVIPVIAVVEKEPEPVVEKPVAVVEKPAPEKVIVAPVVEKPAPEKVIVAPAVKEYSGSAESYTIQIMASYKKVDVPMLAGKYPVEIQYGSDKYYRYITGIFANKSDAEQELSEIRQTQYKQSFIRKANLDAYLSSASEGSGQNYTIQLVALKQPKEISAINSPGDIQTIEGPDGYFRYIYCSYPSIIDAQKALKEVIQKGFENALIRKTSEIPGF